LGVCQRKDSLVAQSSNRGCKLVRLNMLVDTWGGGEGGGGWGSRHRTTGYTFITP